MLIVVHNGDSSQHPDHGIQNVKARAELPEIHCSESDKNSRLAPASGKITATPMEPTVLWL
jgi:hypothetical protein